MASPSATSSTLSDASLPYAFSVTHLYFASLGLLTPLQFPGPSVPASHHCVQLITFFLHQKGGHFWPASLPLFHMIWLLSIQASTNDRQMTISKCAKLGSPNLDEFAEKQHWSFDKSLCDLRFRCTVPCSLPIWRRMRAVSVRTPARVQCMTPLELKPVRWLHLRYDRSINCVTVFFNLDRQLKKY